MYKTCHTAESSMRQRELERGLLAAMGQLPYEKITLTELCRQLNIPRKSFYRYFPTKDDCLLALIDHTLSDCNDVALGSWNGNTALDQQVQLRFFRYWQAHGTFLDAMRANGFQHLLLDRTTVIVDHMKQNREAAGFAREQVEYFIAYGLMTVVLRWHHYGFPGTAQEMAEVFGSLLTTPEISIDRLLL